VFEFSLSNPSALLYTFTFTNGTAGSADYTHYNVPGCATTGTGKTTADTIDEIMKTFTIVLELRLLEQSMIMMRLTVATIAPASATGKSCCLNSA
jgi:hypothetical protein